MKMFAFMPQLIIWGQLILPVMLFLTGEEHKHHFLLRAVCSLFSSMIILYLYVNLPVIFSSMTKDIMSYFITYFLVVLFAWSAYRISAVSAVFISSCSYALQHIAFCLGKLLLGNINYGTFFLAFSMLSPLVLGLFFYFAVLRRNEYIYRNADFRQVFLSMLLLFVCIALNLLRDEETGGMVYMNLYDLLLCCSCLMLQFSISYSAKIHEENKTLELLINQQHLSLIHI